MWYGVGNISMAGFLGGCAAAWISLGGWTALSFNVADYGLPWLFLAVVVDIAVLDFGLYWTHRLMHHPTVYRHIHHLHHQFKAPFLFTYTAMHPAEQILYTSVMAIPLFAVPQHAGSYLAAVAYTWIIGMIDHSGVRVELPLPLHTTSRFHDDHHIYVRCNYGHHTYLWDMVYGTARFRDQPARAATPSLSAKGAK
jgi:lathosterol oxidase